jgi:hypothetical protein
MRHKASACVLILCDVGLQVSRGYDSVDWNWLRMMIMRLVRTAAEVASQVFQDLSGANLSWLQPWHASMQVTMSLYVFGFVVPAGILDRGSGKSLAGLSLHKLLS